MFNVNAVDRMLTSKAGSDKVDCSINDIDDSVEDIHEALIHRTVTAENMHDTPPRTMMSRFRRRGCRYYVLLTLMIVVTAAIVLYYGPFSRRTVKSKFRGSASVQRAQTVYGKYGQKLSQLDLDVKRISSQNRRTMADLLPLGRITEKPGRQSDFYRNNPYLQAPGQAKIPNNWPVREQEETAEEVGYNDIMSDNEQKTSRKTFELNESPTTSSRPRLQGPEIFSSYKGKSYLQKSYDKSKVSTVTVNEEELARIYGLSSSTSGTSLKSVEQPYGMPTKTPRVAEGPKIEKNKKIQLGDRYPPRKSPRGPYGVNEDKGYGSVDSKWYDNTVRRDEFKRDNRSRPNFVRQSKKVTSSYGLPNLGQQDVQNQYGQQDGRSNQFGQPEQKYRGREGQPYGQQLGQLNEGQRFDGMKKQESGNQLYDSYGQPVQGQYIGERNKPSYLGQTVNPPPSPAEQYGRLRQETNNYGQQEVPSKFEWYGQRKQDTDRYHQESQAYGQPNNGQYGQQFGKLSNSNPYNKPYGNSPLPPRFKKKPPDSFAEFYGSIGKRKDTQGDGQPSESRQPPFAEGQQFDQSYNQNVGTNQKVGSYQIVNPPLRAANDQGFQQENNLGIPKFDEFKNSRQQSLQGDNQRQQIEKFYGQFGDKSLGGALPQGPLENKVNSNHEMGTQYPNQMAGQQPNGRPSQMAVQQLNERFQSGYDKPSNYLGNYQSPMKSQEIPQSIAESDKNIPLVDEQVKKSYKPVPQEKYRFANGVFEKILQGTNSNGVKTLIDDKSAFYKLNGAISNAVDHLLNGTRSVNNTRSYASGGRSVSGREKFMTQGRPVSFLQNMTSNATASLPHNYTFPFLNPNLRIDDRVSDLVSRLTVDEVIAQSVSSYDKLTPGIERLGIKKFNWITECLHGHAKTLGTAFPQAIGMAAAFSESLIYNVSEAISKEVRAEWNDLQQKDSGQINYGITCFSPTVNILRHPLWGRNQETYGEDPFLTSKLAKVYVRGMQGNNGERMRVAAGCKHFAAHSGPENGRRSFDAKVSKEDMHMTYLPAFKACVKAGSGGLMCSYNRINGIPSCANKDLLTETAKKEWGFNGYVVSDAGALDNIHLYHMYTKSPAQSAAAAVSAGCNLELAPSRKAVDKLKEALTRELVTEELLRDNVKPLFRTRMRLGEFDPPETSEFRDLSPYQTIQSQAHKDLAKKAAKMSFVLLKNVNNALPIKDKVKRVAVIGPFSKSKSDLYGLYSPAVSDSIATSPYDGLSKIGESTSQAYGCLKAGCPIINEEDVKYAVTGSDVVFVCLGTGGEREQGDRVSLSLPGRQMELLQLAASYANGKPVILLLFNGSPVDLSDAIINPRVSAILECWFPAQSAGAALYETLTAQDIDSVPSGRLPMTWPESLRQVPEMEDYSMSGRTYRYFNGDPLYPFGFGLSYTKFQYLGIRVSPKIVGSSESVIVSVSLQNTGSYDAYEVVQLYLNIDEKIRQVHKSAPLRQLVGFERVQVNRTQVVRVRFQITAKQRTVFSTKNGVDSWVPIHGKFQVFAGGQQPHQKVTVPSNVVQAEFEVLALSSRKLT